MHSTSSRGFTYYNDHAQLFASQVQGRLPTADARSLVEQLAHGSRIVDAGCGTGEDAAYLAQAGFRVYAYDASESMVAITRAKLAQLAGLQFTPVVACHDHEALSLAEPADAILASASLLFLEDSDLARALARLGDQLAAGGQLLASFKLGDSPRVQDDGRTYFDRMPVHLPWMAESSGLEPVAARTQVDVLGRSQSWVTFVLRKPTR